MSERQVHLEVFRVDKRKFLVVIDPSHERHLALERMIDIIEQRAEWPLEFHLLIGFESEDKADPNTPNEVVRSSEWLTDLLKPLEGSDVEYSAEYFWTRNWRESIQEAAERYVCDTIMLCES